MPRIINAYDSNSAIGESLAKLGEAIYGDGAKNEVYRQKALSQKTLNDLVTGDAGLDDPRLAKAQLGIGGGARDTFAGLGRGLANERGIAAGHDTTSRLNNADTVAGGERNNIRTNAETRYGTDRGYDQAIATNAATNEAGERNNVRTTQASRDVGAGNNAATLEATRIQGENQHRTQMDIDGRTLTPISDGNGGFVYEQKSNAVGRGAPMTTDQVKAGVISQALQTRAKQMQPQAFPEGGAQPYNPAGAQPVSVPQQPAAPQGDIFAHLTPQVRALIGVNTETPMVNPRDNRTGMSRDNGTTLDNGQPATGFVPTTPEGRLATERDNNVIQNASKVLPPAPTGYPDTAKDAGLTSGLKSVGQQVLNHTLGATGLGEPFPAVNRARESLQNQAQATRELIAQAPGRAAIMDKKWADALIPQPGMLGVTGINATEQMNRSVQLTGHLRQMYEIVQQDAVNPQTPPAERVKMEAYLRNLGHVIQLREKVTPEPDAAAAPAPSAGAPAARPRAVNPVTKQTIEWDGAAWVPAQ